MAKKMVKALTSAASRVRKDRDSLKTNIPMEIIRLLKLESGDEIEWDPIYERRQVVLSKAPKKVKS